MKVEISKEVLGKYPNVKIGIVTAKNLKIKNADPEVEKIKQQVELEIRNKYDSQTLSQHPFINAWRETYRSFGVTKVKNHLPSAEALIKSVLKENNLPKINTLVDLYCMVSAKNMIPIGGYDLEKINGNIVLRFSKGGEKFLGLGKLDEWKETNSGEVVYADDEKILCRRWNYKDCKQSAITIETKNVCMQIDGAEDIPLDVVKKTTEELAETIKKFCGGTVKAEILDINKRESEI